MKTRENSGKFTILITSKQNKLYDDISLNKIGLPANIDEAYNKVRLLKNNNNE